MDNDYYQDTSHFISMHSGHEIKLCIYMSLTSCKNALSLKKKKFNHYKKIIIALYNLGADKMSTFTPPTHTQSHIHTKLLSFMEDFIAQKKGLSNMLEHLSLPPPTTL